MGLWSAWPEWAAAMAAQSRASEAVDSIVKSSYLRARATGQCRTSWEYYKKLDQASDLALFARNLGARSWGYPPLVF